MSHLIHSYLLGPIQFAITDSVLFEKEPDFIAACEEVFISYMFTFGMNVIYEFNSYACVVPVR